MGFYEVLAQVIELLQREGRTSYRALKRQFHLDDDYLEDLKVELIDVKQLAVDQDGKMLVWTDAPATTVPPPMPSQERPPLSYTPPYLAEKSRTTRSALAGERKQVTVLFADLKDSTDAPKKPIGRRSGRATPVRNSLCLCAHKHMRGVIVLTVACQRPSYISKQQMTQTQREEEGKMHVKFRSFSSIEKEYTPHPTLPHCLCSGPLGRNSICKACGLCWRHI